MTKFEYKEPEFKVVQANVEDVLTLSNEPVDWDTGANGNNGGVGFGSLFNKKEQPRNRLLFLIEN